MQISAYPFPAALTEKQFFQKTVIVVDVLRATTSMLTALENGAAQIVPVREPEEAMQLISKLGRGECLLAGERGGLKINGFDFGNSPLEFLTGAAAGKTLVFCTTNGTGAIYAARTAKTVLIGCLRNRLAVACAAAETGDDIVLLCAGTQGEASMDDMVAVGGIYRALQLSAGQQQVEANDFARVCGHMYDLFVEGKSELAITRHYAALQALGFSQDLTFCFMQDQSDGVPVYENGSIRM